MCVSLLVYVRKLSDDEHPLGLRLCAGPNEKVLSFVLKENETGEVNVSATWTWRLRIQTTLQIFQAWEMNVLYMC